MARAIRKDAYRFQSAYHLTTSRLERFKRVHDLCVEAVRAALFGPLKLMAEVGKGR